MKKTIGKAGRILTILAVIMMAVICMGCGKATPENVLTKMSLKMLTADVKNCRSQTEYTFSMQAAQKKVDALVSWEQETSTDPEYVSHINMVTDMGALGKQDIEAYVTEEGDMYYIYAKNADKWSKQLVAKDTLQDSLRKLGLNDMTPSLGMTKSLNNMTLTEESLDGEDTYKIEGSVSTAELAGEAESLAGSLGLGDSANMDLSNLSDIKVTLWVYKSSGLLAKLQMDMTDLMNEVIKEAAKGTQAQGQLLVYDVVLTTTYKDYGKVGQISLSDDAKNALMK